MKTHSLATALKILADILYNGPNVELSSSMKILKDSEFNTSQVAVNLQTLLMLSKFKKQDWVNLISENNFDIEIKKRYASRDILGKLLNYLDSHPEAIDTMKKKSIESKSTDSALIKALDLLLRDTE